MINKRFTSIIAVLVGFTALVAIASAQQLSSYEGTWQLDITVDQQNYTTHVWICADQFNSTFLWGAFGLTNAPRGFFTANIINTSNAVGPAHQVFTESAGFVSLNIDTFNGQDVLFFSLSFDDVNGAPFAFNASGTRLLLENNGEGFDGQNNSSFRDLCLYSNNSINILDYQGFWQANNTNNSNSAFGNDGFDQIASATNISICMSENITSIENAQIVYMNSSSNGPQVGSLNGTIFDAIRALGYRTFDQSVFERDGQILFLRDPTTMLGWWWRSEYDFGGRDWFIKSSTVQVLYNGTLGCIQI